MVSNRTSENGFCPRHARRELAKRRARLHRGHHRRIEGGSFLRSGRGVVVPRRESPEDVRRAARTRGHWWEKQEIPLRRSADAIRRYPGARSVGMRTNIAHVDFGSICRPYWRHTNDLPQLVEGADAGRRPHSTHLASPDFGGRLGCLYRTTSPTSRPGTKTNF
jgi:hypothetical protein